MNTNCQFQLNISVARSNKQLLYCSIMDESLGGHFCISGAFSNSHMPSPSPHATSNVGRLYPEFFPSFDFVLGGGRENCGKISKRMHCFMREHRYYRKLWILHCSSKDVCPRLVGCLFFTKFFSMFLSHLSCWGNTMSLSKWSLHMNASNCHELHSRSCLPR